MEGCIEHIVNVTLLTQRHTKETRVSKHQNVPGMSPFVLLVTGKETDYFKMSTIGSHELCFLVLPPIHVSLIQFVSLRCSWQS